jgi:hypothetical protein
MGQQIRKRQTSVRFISPQLLNTVWIVVSTATTELQVEVVSGENSNHVKARSQGWQSIVDYVGCSKTFKNYIQRASRPVLRREVLASGGVGKTVESSRARGGDLIQAYAINLDVARQSRVDGFGQRVATDRVIAIGENDESFLGMGIAVLREEVRREDDGVVEGREALRPSSGEAVGGGVCGTAISGAEQGGPQSLKGEDGDILVRDTTDLGDQLQNAGNFVTEVRRGGCAGVEENGELQLRPVGAAKALKIADDVALVNYCEVAGLQGGHSVVILVERGKAELNLADRRAEADGTLAVGAEEYPAEQQRLQQPEAATGYRYGHINYIGPSCGTLGRAWLRPSSRASPPCGMWPDSCPRYGKEWS